MSEINMNDAPEGYIAVKPVVYESGYGSCTGCDFNNQCRWRSKTVTCSMYTRKDRRDVIFKHAE